MKAPRVYETAAIVLRQRKLGDADKIITLYTANLGKIEAVAKGVRRTTSKLAGHVEPLNHGSFLLAQGRNLDVITQVQTIELFQPLHQDLDRLSRALYCVELVERCTEERIESFEVYRLLLDTLRRISSETGGVDLPVRLLEMSLLDQMGYRPELQRCVMCNGDLGEQAVWCAGMGGGLCLNCRPSDTPVRSLTTECLLLLRDIQQRSARDVLALRIQPHVMDEAEMVTREAFHHALDRDIKSAQFIDEVRRPRRALRPSAATSK